MRPEGVVLPPPAIGQALGLSHRGEQLGVQKLIPKPAVERLCKAVLPRGPWLDVGRGGTAVLAPALEGMGDELRPVVAADVRRSRVEAGELLKHGYHILGLAASGLRFGGSARDRKQVPVLPNHLPNGARFGSICPDFCLAEKPQGELF